MLSNRETHEETAYFQMNLYGFPKNDEISQGIPMVLRICVLQEIRRGFGKGVLDPDNYSFLWEHHSQEGCCAIVARAAPAQVSGKGTPTKVWKSTGLLHGNS